MSSIGISAINYHGPNTPSTVWLPESGQALEPAKPKVTLINAAKNVLQKPAAELPDNATPKAADHEPHKYRLGWRIGSYMVVGAAALTLPLTTAIDYIDNSTGESTEAGGFSLNITPQVGYNFSSLPLFGVLGGVNDQTHRNILSKNISANIEPDGNNDVTTYDRATREAWAQIYSHPKPLEDHLASVAENNGHVWGLAGFNTALIAEVSFAFWALRHRERQRMLAALPASETKDKLLASMRRNKRIVAGVAAAAVLLSDGLAVPALTRNVTRTIPGGTQLYGLASEIQPFLELGEANEKHDDQTAANIERVVKTNADLAPRTGFDRYVLGDDLENNNGQARMFGLLIKTLHAKGIMLGDWATFEDRKLGLYTADTAYFEAGKTTIVSAGGQHETPDGIKYLEDNGIVLPNNTTIDLDAVRSMFLRSYSMTGINSLGTSDQPIPRNPKVSYKNTITAMVKKICQQRPRFLFGHDHKYVEAVTKKAIAAGCAPVAVFGGRLDITKMPLNKDDTYANKSVMTKVSVPGKGSVKEYINDSSAGNDNQPNYGIMKNQGDFTVIDYNPQTNEMILTIITIHPNSQVTVQKSNIFIGPNPFALTNPLIPSKVVGVGTLPDRPLK